MKAPGDLCRLEAEGCRHPARHCCCSELGWNSWEIQNPSLHLAVEHLGGNKVLCLSVPCPPCCDCSRVWNRSSESSESSEPTGAAGGWTWAAQGCTATPGSSTERIPLESWLGTCSTTCSKGSLSSLASWATFLGLRGCAGWAEALDGAEPTQPRFLSPRERR